MDFAITLWAAIPAAVASVVVGWFGGIYAVKSKKIDRDAALVERLTALWEAGLARESASAAEIASLRRELANETAARIRLEASVSVCQRRCGSTPPPAQEAAALLESPTSGRPAGLRVSLPLSTTSAGRRGPKPEG
jgi:hypothetical protein